MYKRQDDACKTAKNPDATQAEREKAAKVFTDMEGTELYEKMMEGSSEIGILPETATGNQ